MAGTAAPAGAGRALLALRGYRLDLSLPVALLVIVRGACVMPLVNAKGKTQKVTAQFKKQNFEFFLVVLPFSF